MLIESKDGQIKRQRCHKCGAVREQDYLHLVEVAPNDIQFECDNCDKPTHPQYHDKCGKLWMNCVCKSGTKDFLEKNTIDLTDEDGNIETHEVQDGLIKDIALRHVATNLVFFLLGAAFMAAVIWGK